MRACGIALTLVILAIPAAAAQRTFVSAAEGSDGNPCTRSSPCRSFAAALSSMDPGGEVVVLDSGGYGPFVATKAATIDAPEGVAAAITVFSGHGISFQGAGSDRLVVRGIQLTGLGGEIGVVLSSGAALHLERALITGFTVLGASAAPGGVLTIHDSTFIGNQSGLQIGNGPVPAGGSVRDSRFEGHPGSAIIAYPNGDVTVSDTAIAWNYNGLIAAALQMGTTARITLERSVVTHNSVGLVTGGAEGTSTIWVSDSTIVFNGIGLISGDPTFGPILSRSNNSVEANGTEGAFTGTFTAE